MLTYGRFYGLKKKLSSSWNSIYRRILAITEYVLVKPLKCCQCLDLYHILHVDKHGIFWGEGIVSL